MHTTRPYAESTGKRGTFIGHRGCPSCREHGRDTKKDNLAVYKQDDGTEDAYCFSCGYYGEQLNGEIEGTRIRKPGSSIVAGFAGDVASIPDRGLTQLTCERYGYKVGYAEGVEVQGAPYCNEYGAPIAWKIRPTNDKSGIKWRGSKHKALPLFGQTLWTADRYQRDLVITEGEIDCLSVSQVLGERKPVVSIPDGAASAAKSISQAWEFVSQFDKVILCFDNDPAGHKAAETVGKLPWRVGQLHIAKLPLKDANEMLKAHRTKELSNSIFRAAPVGGEGVLDTDDLFELFMADPPKGLDYPFQCLNDMLFGMRPDEMVVWGAGTGIGKTTVLWSLIHQLLNVHHEKVAVFTVEGNKSSMLKQLVGTAIQKRLGLEHVWNEFSKEEQKAFFERSIPKGKLFWYHSSYAKELFAKMRYIAVAKGVKWFFIDHITSMVAGKQISEMDEMVTDLRALVEELDIGIHVVSHLRKSDGTPFEEGARVSLDDFRGSGAVKQLANTVIALEREKGTSNTTVVRILKNRYEGGEGVAGSLLWDRSTGVFTEVQESFQ